MVRIIKLVVSLVLVAAIVWQVGPDAVIPESIFWSYLAAAVVVFLISNIMGARQWKILLKIAQIDLSSAMATRAYFVGLFFNNFLIGNVGGDVLRALDVRRHAGHTRPGGAAAGVATIVMDRFLGFFTMMWFAGLAALADRQHVKIATAIFTLIALFVILGVILTSRRVGRKTDTLVIRLLPKRMADKIVELRAGFVDMRQRPMELVGAAAISVMVQGMRILVHYLCGRTVGLDIPLLHFIAFIPLVSVAAAIPISTGGLGTREWAAVGLFGTLGVAGSSIVAMELLAHAITLLSSLPGAYVFITRDRRPLKAPVAIMVQPNEQAMET